MTQPTIPATEHRHVGGSAGGPGENSAECACGTVFDGFDTYGEVKRVLDRHIAEAPNTRRADQLAAGDWVALLADHGDPWETRRNTKVAAVFPYTDEVENDRVLLVTRTSAAARPWTNRLPAEEPVRVLTADELAAIRKQAERAQRIADIRAFADWLEANPWVPMPHHLYGSKHVNGLAGELDDVAALATVREIATRLGVETDESADDRTRMKFNVGRFEYSLLAWHKDGRPVEAAPVVEDERCGTCGESLREIGRGTLGHVPGEACAPVDDLGFGYSRELDDPTPVSPARGGPVHRGGVVDGGQLVDETPAESPAWDSPASGLTVEADLSRGPLAGTTPVVTYFSFGHGQTDPDSRQRLIDHYVTVVAPTYEECRTAMFASRYENRWSFDYLAGRASTTEAVSVWAEHEVIVAEGLDPAMAEVALKAAAALLVGESTCGGGC
jgi:hypothetical protein